MPQLTGYDKFIQQALKYGFSLWGTAKTGQKTSYFQYDDGHFEKGYPKAPPRFKDNGDGTITDNATGLMWAKDPSVLGLSWGTEGNPIAMDWEYAIANCEVLIHAGHGDWRLPNIKELMSIVDYGRAAPSIDSTYFPNTQYLGPGRFYWTATTNHSYTPTAWVVEFATGDVGQAIKETTYYVRPVRLGVPK